MTSLAFSLLALLPLSLQQATSTTGRAPERPSPRSAPAAQAVLVSYGEYVTQTGVGAGGADVSEIEPGLSDYGHDMDVSAGRRLADDFNVPSNQTWDIDSFRWITYQVGAPTTGTVTGMGLALWTSDPLLGGPPAYTGPANSLVTQTWTGVYRVQAPNLTDSSRALIEVVCGALWAPKLGAGTYWIDAAATGSLPGGPYASVRVPRLGTDNARQFSAGTWSALTDTQSGLSQDLLFALGGRASAASVITYCSSKPSSLPNCVPTVTAIGEPYCLASQGLLLQCAPVPGRNVGLFFYTLGGPGGPVNTPYGQLCLNGAAGIFRVLLNGNLPWAGTPNAGGTLGACDGAYLLDFNRYFALQVGNPALICGSTVNGQFWYRDPANPGAANFSQAAQFTMTSNPPPPNAPSGQSVSPTSGGEGTVLTITGSGFGSSPGDLKVLLSDGIGFADVTTASDTTLSATIFAAATTSPVGAVTIVRGNGTPLPSQVVNSGGIVSTSSQVEVIVNGAGSNFGSFNLGPASSNCVGANFGVPLVAGGLSMDLSTLSGDNLTVRAAFKLGSGEFYVFSESIDFSGTPTAGQRADHLSRQMNASYGTVGLSASSSGSGVRISMAGSTYGSAVIGVY